MTHNHNAEQIVGQMREQNTPYAVEIVSTDGGPALLYKPRERSRVSPILPLSECEEITDEHEKIERGDVVIEARVNDHHGTTVYTGDVSLRYITGFHSGNGDITNAEYFYVSSGYSQVTSHNVALLASDLDDEYRYFRV